MVRFNRRCFRQDTGQREHTTFQPFQLYREARLSDGLHVRAGRRPPLTMLIRPHLQMLSFALSRGAQLICDNGRRRYRLRARLLVRIDASSAVGSDTAHRDVIAQAGFPVQNTRIECA